MPDAGGNIKGISLSGKAGETLDRIFKSDPWQCLDCGGRRCECDLESIDFNAAEACPKCKTCGDTKSVRVYGAEDYGVSFECESCPDCVKKCEWCDEEANEEISGCPACIDCWEKAYNLD